MPALATRDNKGFDMGRPLQCPKGRSQCSPNLRRSREVGERTNCLNSQSIEKDISARWRGEGRAGAAKAAYGGGGEVAGKYSRRVAGSTWNCRKRGQDLTKPLKNKGKMRLDSVLPHGNGWEAACRRCWRPLDVVLQKCYNAHDLSVRGIIWMRRKVFALVVESDFCHHLFFRRQGAVARWK